MFYYSINFNIANEETLIFIRHSLFYSLNWKYYSTFIFIDSTSLD